ncbi:hypothetical protein CBL_10412 [Carabus blaptoides fortunei]
MTDTLATNRVMFVSVKARIGTSIVQQVATGVKKTPKHLNHNPKKVFTFSVPVTACQPLTSTGNSQKLQTDRRGTTWRDAEGERNRSGGLCVVTPEMAELPGHDFRQGSVENSGLWSFKSIEQLKFRHGTCVEWGGPVDY